MLPGAFFSAAKLGTADGDSCPFPLQQFSDFLYLSLYLSTGFLFSGSDLCSSEEVATYCFQAIYNKTTEMPFPIFSVLVSMNEDVSYGLQVARLPPLRARGLLLQDVQEISEKSKKVIFSALRTMSKLLYSPWIH